MSFIRQLRNSTDAEAASPVTEAILIELAVLSGAIVVGRFLERIKFNWMGEAGAALIIGIIVGLIMKGSKAKDTLAESVSFNENIFFDVLLPAIMFDAGFSLSVEPFIVNVGSILMFAFAGTTIASFGTGLLMWGFGLAGWCYKMQGGLLANLVFGALISATDPVTVLAVFNKLGAEKSLYHNVFGESVLNDAVGVVMFRVVTEFLDGKPVTAGSVWAGIGKFVGIFLGSVAIGIAVALITALLYRSGYLYSGPIHPHVPGGSKKKILQEESSGNVLFEGGLLVVLAWATYLVAEVAYCSGIVAVFVNGVVVNMYVRPNLSAEAAEKFEAFFKILAGLFELFVFVYIGLTLFLMDQSRRSNGYMWMALVALAVTRAANVVPLSALVNFLRPKYRHITPRAQFMMWWAGLRGAMAFALSMEAATKYGKDGEIMKITTFYIVLFTVIFNGGTSGFVMQRLKLRQADLPPGLEEQAAAHKAETEGDEPPAGAAGDAAVVKGAPENSGSLRRRGGGMLARIRQANDGYSLYGKFHAWNTKVTKFFVHPHAIYERQLQTTSRQIGRSSLAGKHTVDRRASGGGAETGVAGAGVGMGTGEQQPGTQPHTPPTPPTPAPLPAGAVEITIRATGTGA
ncbi:hypothetical protein HYH03_000517 [Edaphochlamys debaryana]|uniref:Cation/H+ exchanger transmembrane domain-containing protein n=1 Tax=Edaphochlamys debaryana TaxID=47281 RepID=A0A835YG04_9CHLO|nr:hypothetical protein HYH03_000517 [Edaphochlamys debaryana]|eukprot:KAG2502023.1 hypothetical protein HYH03_000517 [Edaphochlamys debaryana]